MPEETPYQTVGPFFDFGLCVAGAETLVDDTIDGRRIMITGRVLDGSPAPVPDALIEIWQADPSGQYVGAAPSTDAHARRFRGFGRCGTDANGRFSFTTVMPGRVPGPQGLQAPHLVAGVLARGIQTRLLTRIYFEDQPSNEEDAILRLVPADRRSTLIARLGVANEYTFDIVLQGQGETVFFDV